MAVLTHDARAAATGLAPAILGALCLSGVLALAGTAGYVAPAGAALALGCGAVLWGAMRGRTWALSTLLAFSVIALNLSFRQREVGAVGLDWQNGTKLLTWAAMVLLGAVRWRSIAPLARDPVIALMLATSFISLASAAWSGVPAYTAANAFGLFANLAMAGLMATEIGERRTLRVLTGSLAAMAALNLAGGVLVPDLAVMPPSVEESADRLQGFAGHPNALGQQVAILCLMATGARLNGAIGLPALAVALGLGLAAGVWSGSRFSLAAFAVGLLVVLARRHRLARPALIAGLALAPLGLAFAAVFPVPNPEHLLGGLSRSGSSSEMMTLTGRTVLWEVAVERIAERPWLGWGFQGTEGLLEEGLPRSFYGSGVNPHNMTLQTLLSLGFLGSLPAFAMFAILIARIFACPDDMRDMVVLYLVVSGLGEIEIFGVPVIQNLAAYWIFARHAAIRHGPGPGPVRPDGAMAERTA